METIKYYYISCEINAGAGWRASHELYEGSNPLQVLDSSDKAGFAVRNFVWQEITKEQFDQADKYEIFS